MPEEQPQLNRSEFLTLQQAAVGTPYSADYFRLRAGQGKLRAVKLGKVWFTTREWVNQYILSHSVHRAAVVDQKQDIKPVPDTAQNLAVTVSGKPLVDKSQFTIESKVHSSRVAHISTLAELFDQAIDSIIDHTRFILNQVWSFRLLSWQTVSICALLAALVVISRSPYLAKSFSGLAGQSMQQTRIALEKIDSALSPLSDFVWLNQKSLGQKISYTVEPYGRVSMPIFFSFGQSFADITEPLDGAPFVFQLEVGKRISPSVKSVVSVFKKVAFSEPVDDSYGGSRVKGISTSEAEESLFSYVRFLRWLDGIRNTVIAWFSRDTNVAINVIPVIDQNNQTSGATNETQTEVSPPLLRGDEPAVEDNIPIIPDSNEVVSNDQPEETTTTPPTQTQVSPPAGSDSSSTPAPQENKTTVVGTWPSTVSNFTVSGKLTAGTISSSSLNSSSGTFGTITADKFTVKGPMSFPGGFTAGTAPRDLTFSEPTGLLDVYSLQVRTGGAVVQGPLTVRGALNLEGGLGLTRMSELQVSGPAVVDTLDAGRIEASRVTAGTIESTGHIFASSLGVTGFAGINNLSVQRLTVDKALTVNGPTTFTSSVTLPGTTVGGALTPSVDNTYDLGSSGARWQNAVLGPGGVQLSSTAGTTGAGTDYTLGELKFSGTNLVLESSVQGAGTVGDIILTPSSGNTILNDGTNTLLSVLDQGTYAFLRLSDKATGGDPAACSPGDIYFNSTDATVKACTAVNAWETLDGGGGGSSVLSDITAAIADHTIASGNNAQTWNWALTTAAKTAFTFGENSASTGGAGSQFILKAATLATSTATPFVVTNLGAADSFRVNDETGDGDTSPFIIDNAGLVGIGTTTPGALLDLGTAGSTAGVVRLAGSGSGNVTLQTAAAAGTWSMTLPASGGTNTYALTTNGSGVTNWSQSLVPYQLLMVVLMLRLPRLLAHWLMVLVQLMPSRQQVLPAN
ncbi:MAG: hypothetical protein UV57_C0037G0016 [Parcubacteria group bacterium GW2011_GWD2_43_10]|nr:MAG: hypothetical protein UV57_C0037G0016 [Parcubacteria group bacterium GW2011_GWD2_43_10]